MPETQRTVSEIYTLLADNTSGNISPQDLRDAFETLRIGHGQIAIAAVDAAAITISDTTNYFEATAPVWTIGSAVHNFDESGGNGRLTYTGIADIVVHIACSISMTGSNNQTIHWRIGKTGTTDATSEVQRRISTGTDVGSTALHLITTLSTNDYLSLWVRNATGANNVTLEVANLQTMAMAD